MAIQTSHVGSLPRSQKVVDYIFAREKGEDYNEIEFDQVMTEAVNDTVRKQKKAGITIVSDGETSKISYATYVKDRYHGFAGDSPRNAPADLKKFPNYLQKLANDGGTPKYARPMCVSKLEPKKNDDLIKDIDNLKKALKGNDIKKGFMNAASPGVISLFLQNDYYPSREDYLEALSNLMQSEYEMIVKSGLDLQIDCPDLALSRHMLFNDMTDNEFVKVASINIESLNNALRNIPKDKIKLGASFDLDGECLRRDNAYTLLDKIYPKPDMKSEIYFGSSKEEEHQTFSRAYPASCKVTFKAVNNCFRDDQLTPTNSHISGYEEGRILSKGGINDGRYIDHYRCDHPSHKEFMAELLRKTDLSSSQ